MKQKFIQYYPIAKNEFLADSIEDAFYDSTLQYSLRHIAFIGNIAPEDIQEALQKALHVCHLAGMNSKHHFKQIFLFDEKIGTLRIEWLMSKTGFNLMIIQTPTSNEKMALWLWKLAESKSW
jgi:hypothetical protein